MIVKHSSDETPKPMPVGLRLARVISIGNGTVDVCPIGSSVVLHDIPVTSATTMQVGDVINLQMMDNKRFAFAQQNVTSASESSEKTVTIINAAAESGGGGSGSTGTLTVGSGLSVNPASSGNLGGAVSLALDASVARSTWNVVAGSGLTGGGSLSPSGITLNVGAGNGIAVAADSVSVKLAAISGLSFATDALQVADSIAGDGLQISSKVLAVDSTVVRTSREIATGNGLTGGGNLSANRTLSVVANTASGIAVDGSGVAVNLASASGLNFTNEGKLRVGQGDGIAVNGSFIQAVALTNGGLSVASGGISVVAGDGIAVSAGVSAKANTDKAVVVENAGIGVVANTSLGIQVDASGVGVNRKSTESGLKFENPGGALSVNLASPSGLSFSGHGLQLDNSVAGDGLVIGDKILSVASSSSSLTVSSNSVDVNYAHAFPWTNNHTWSTDASIASAGAMSGFAGSGWIMRNSGSLGLIDIDELSVRGRLRVYELLVQQIRATNGSIFVSSSAKAASVTGSGPYTITIDAKDTDMCPFAVGDLLRAQRVDLGGLSSNSPDIVWQSNLRVDSVSGLSFTATLVSGNAPAAGMEYVRLGNDSADPGLVNRKSSVYLTADDSFAPYIDVVSGVSSFADWGTKIRVRIGRLDGVTASITSNPGSDEFGIWAGTGTGVNDRYIRVSDKIVELRNVPIELFGDSSTPQVRLTAGGANGNIPSFAMGTTLPTSSLQPAGSGVWMGQEAVGGNYTFRVGAVASGALTNGILWNGTSLTVTGNINIVGGNAATKAYTDAELGKVVNNTTGKLTFSFVTTPPTGSGSGLYLGSTHLGYYNSGWKTYMDSSGNFFLNGSGTQGLTWTSSTSTLAIDGEITARSGSIEGFLTIGTGGGIYQGTGSSVTGNAGTGLKIWRDGNIGRIAGYNNNVEQWGANTSGVLTAGGGNVNIASSGIYIVPKRFLNSGTAGRPGANTPVGNDANYLSNSQGYTFDSTTNIGTSGGRYGIYGWRDDGSDPKRFGMEISAWGLSNNYKGTIIIQGTNVFLRSEDNTNGYVSAETPFWAYDMYINGIYKRGSAPGQSGTSDIFFYNGINVTGNGTFSGNLYIGNADTYLYRSAANMLRTPDSVTIDGGLNVGTATGATAGQVRAHELYLGTGSDVRLYRSAANMLRTPDSATIDGGLNIGTYTGAGAGDVHVQNQLGVGTDSPSGAADIRGTFRSQLTLGAATNAGAVSFRRGSDGLISGYVGFAAASEANEFNFHIGSGGGYFTWDINVSGPGLSEVMRLTNAGRLGIGTASPAYPLDVEGSIQTSGSIRIWQEIQVVRNATGYTGYIYVPNTAYTNLWDQTPTQWAGSATKAVGSYQINLARTTSGSANNLPSGVKAVVLAVRGQWTTASVNNRINIRDYSGASPLTGGTNQLIITAGAANIPVDNVGIVNVGTSNSIVVEVAGASVSSGLIRVIGYYI